MKSLLAILVTSLVCIGCNQDEFIGGEYSRRNQDQTPDKGYIDIDTKVEPVVAVPKVPDVPVIPTPRIPQVVPPTPAPPVLPSPPVTVVPPAPPAPPPPPPPAPEPELVSSDFYLAAPTPITQQFNQAKSIKQSKTFRQEGYGLTDVLLVVDNSNSMYDEHTNLSARLSALLSRVADSDWQIGIISTDHSDTCLRHTISKNTPNHQTVFAGAINRLGTGGSNTEEGFRMAYRGISCSSSFPRKGSTLAVVVVSDEDNCGISYLRNSDGQWVESKNCRDNSFYTDRLLLNYATNVLGRTLGKDFTFHGLIYDGSKACTGKFGTIGESYRRLAAKTDGKVGSICSNDYTPFFNQISLDISSKLDRVFDLGLGAKDSILAGTVDVKVNGTSQPQDAFSIAAGKLSMVTLPPPNSLIAVSYELDTDQGLLEDITLDHQPFEGRVDVFIDEVKQPASAFTLSGKTLRFLTDPPLNSVVRLNYQVAPVIPTLFQIDKNVTVDKVLINGKKHQGFSYNSATGQVAIAAAALKPDTTVRIFYKRPKT